MDNFLVNEFNTAISKLDRDNINMREVEEIDHILGLMQILLDDNSYDDDFNCRFIPCSASLLKNSTDLGVCFVIIIYVCGLHIRNDKLDIALELLEKLKATDSTLSIKVTELDEMELSFTTNKIADSGY